MLSPITHHLSPVTYHLSPKKKAAPTPKSGKPPTHELPGVRGFTPVVLLPAAAARTDSSAVGRRGAPASIPKRSGRDLEVHSCERCRSTWSRTGLLHCTPKR